MNIRVDYRVDRIFFESCGTFWILVGWSIWAVYDLQKVYMLCSIVENSDFSLLFQSGSDLTVRLSDDFFVVYHQIPWHSLFIG